VNFNLSRLSGKKEDREPLYKVNALAARHYYDAMKEEGNAGRGYMDSRSIDRRAMKAFGIGYAKRRGDFHGKVEGDEAMLEAALKVGLVYKSDRGYRDKFEDRVMFPIINPVGKVVGFGGRDVGGTRGDFTPAKYVNSDASSVFAKATHLYGLYTTGGAVRAKKQAILVEGYMDAVALYMHGVDNVVAQLGTAFTADQARLLKRYADSVVLATDMDEAGRKAAEASMELLRQAGLQVRVLSYEGGKDPDEFIAKRGRAAFDEAVAGAEPMVEYKMSRIFARHDTSASDELAAAVAESASYLARLNPGERGIYTKKLADRSGLSEEALRLQIETATTGDAGRLRFGARGADGAGGAAHGSGGGDRGAFGEDGFEGGSGGGVDRDRESLLENILRTLIANPERLGEASYFRPIFREDAKGEVLEALITLSVAGDDSLDEKLGEALSPEAAGRYTTLAQEAREEYAGDAALCPVETPRRCPVLPIFCSCSLPPSLARPLQPLAHPRDRCV
jgi:DNA primase catalytic core